MLKFLVPVDGSAHSGRTVDQLIALIKWYRESPDLHLLNVQPPLRVGGRVTSVIGQDQIDQYHQDEGLAALAPARQKLDAAGISYHHHIGLGEVVEVIMQYVKDKGCDQIVMGTRGLSGVSSIVLGSVANKVIHVANVPVLLLR